jgi:DNA polymerase IV (DinB-like DNA polymerase)
MRIIAHLDMDAYFAAIEERDNPEFAGLPIVVGADPKNGMGRGVVSTANYCARHYGIHSAMPISKAWRLAYTAEKNGGLKTIFLPVSMDKYVKVSDKIIGIVQKNTSIFEQTSIDEAYLDLSSQCQEKNIIGGWEKAIEIIKTIKKEIWENEHLTASVGIGPNKLIAKLVSAKFKPDGLKAVRSDEINSFLDPLSVGDIPGIGPKTEEFLHRQKIFKVSDLKKISYEQLVSWFGKWGSDIYQKVRGEDDSEVSNDREVKSISEQETFEKDTLEASFLIGKLEAMAKRVIKRLHGEEIKGFRTVTLTVRFFDFETKSKAHTLKSVADSYDILKIETLKLLLPFLDRRANSRLKPIRLIGVGVENFK